VPALLHDVRLPDKGTSLNPNVGATPEAIAVRVGQTTVIEIS
jgi:hypothetical protein